MTRVLNSLDSSSGKLVTTYREEGEVGWLKTQLETQFGPWTRLRVALRLAITGRFTFEFFWAEAGPDTSLYLSDVSFTIGGE